MGDSLVLNGVCKTFNKTQVLKDLSLTLHPGDFTLLLGANGSGKSTLLRILSGLLSYDKGDLQFGAEKTGKIPYAKIGHSGHASFLYSDLTVVENIDLHRQLADTSVGLEEIVEEWDLSEIVTRFVKNLSQGNLARVSLCRALLADPNFIFLDEPTSALDERNVRGLFKYLDRVTAATAGPLVVIASHDIERLRSRCNRVILLHQGSLAGDSKALAVERKLDGERAINEIIEKYRKMNR